MLILMSRLGVNLHIDYSKLTAKIEEGPWIGE